MHSNITSIQILEISRYLHVIRKKIYVFSFNETTKRPHNGPMTISVLKMDIFESEKEQFFVATNCILTDVIEMTIKINANICVPFA